jgi:uncharacterized protein (DUF1330 family)
MRAYAVAHMQSIHPGPDIVEYLTRIDGTLGPYEGRFLIHGDPGETREGNFVGNVSVIEFPDRARATEWYDSPAYRAIRPLRIAHITGWVIVVDGVPPGPRRD